MLKALAAAGNRNVEKIRVFQRVERRPLRCVHSIADLTGSQCSPNTVHWVYDTYMLANGTGKALVNPAATPGSS
jgi:hypothetical protein